MGRTPPPEVLDELRRDVGFGCPAEGPDGERCDRPYLTWHHFDPSWREREHHDPTGMIALCQEHHDKADGNYYTKEQLHAMKGTVAKGLVTARMDYLRRELVLVLGHGFYLARSLPRVIPFLQGNHVPISIERDQDGYWTLDIDMRTRDGMRRFAMQRNVWRLVLSPEQFECPPKKPRFKLAYDDGDFISVAFFEIDDSDAFHRRYPWSGQGQDHPYAFSFPISMVEIDLSLYGGTVQLASGTPLRGINIGESISIDNVIGIWSGAAFPWQDRVRPMTEAGRPRHV